MSKLFKLSQTIKRIFNIFNYKIEHVNSWYLRQENYVPEISSNDEEQNGESVAKKSVHRRKSISQLWNCFESIHKIQGNGGNF